MNAPLIHWCLLALILTACANFQWNQPSGDIFLLHYNIKELDSSKIENKTQNLQLKNALQIINRFKFNILSLNELQYDLPGIPNETFQSRGKNLNHIKELLGLNLRDWSSSFWPANTGQYAGLQLSPMPLQTKQDQAYLTFDKNNQYLADPYNHGLFPAQYSTGALFKFKKLRELIITDLPWLKFNPAAKLSQYASGDNSPLPLSLPLFDKNFSDITLDIHGREIHLILLHAVPSYHFGSAKSPNYARNQDQLRFLEWYTTGATDIPVDLEAIRPLSKNSSFIIVGDLNSDYRNHANPGSAVIRRLMSKLGVWMENPGITNESPGYEDRRLSLTLDYIFFSNDLELIQGGIYRPQESKKLIECNASPPKNLLTKRQPKPQVQLIYFQENNKPCYGTVSKDFYEAKLASDHFPIWAHFK